MITPKQKLFLSIILMMLFYGCQTPISEQIHVKRILKGTVVRNSQYYQFPEDAKYVVGNDTLSLSSKVDYDKFGELVCLTLYKSEGPLNYSKEEVIKDMNLLNSVEERFKQIWYLVNDTLLVIEADTMNVNINKKANEIESFVYRKNDNCVVVFEVD